MQLTVEPRILLRVAKGRQFYTTSDANPAHFASIERQPRKQNLEQKPKSSFLKRLGFPLAAMAAALGITGCTSEVDRVQKSYEQIQSQPLEQKMDFLKKKIHDQNEDVRVFALRQVFRLPGQEKEKAAFVLKALDIENVYAYKEAKTFLEQNLSTIDFQNQLLKKQLLALLGEAPTIRTETDMILIPMQFGDTTMLMPQYSDSYYKNPKSAAFQKLAAELRQELQHKN
jgi:hypothetical protein